MPLSAITAPTVLPNHSITPRRFSCALSPTKRENHTKMSHTFLSSMQSFHSRMPVRSNALRPMRPVMTGRTVDADHSSTITTTMVKRTFSSLDIGPMALSFASACLGSSGVALRFGGRSLSAKTGHMTRPKIAGTQDGASHSRNRDFSGDHHCLAKSSERKFVAAPVTHSAELWEFAWKVDNMRNPPMSASPASVDMALTSG
mmetsp:Transcript_21206/g.49114  ORF Transcript_21206/g.49114 Transcript_21206/m.49114 type:complete len:202 (+) Transcript_21206:657-1262(+)